MKHKLESKLPEKMSISSDMQVTFPPMAENEKELKSLLMKVKEVSEKIGLKTQHSKKKKKERKSWHLVPSLQGK